MNNSITKSRRGKDQRFSLRCATKRAHTVAEAVIGNRAKPEKKNYADTCR